MLDTQAASTAEPEQESEPAAATAGSEGAVYAMRLSEFERELDTTTSTAAGGTDGLKAKAAAKREAAKAKVSH